MYYSVTEVTEVTEVGDSSDNSEEYGSETFSATTGGSEFDDEDFEGKYVFMAWMTRMLDSTIFSYTSGVKTSFS